MAERDRNRATPDDRDGTARAARWLAAQTAVVALLAGVVHQLTMSTLLEGGMSYMGAEGSGGGAVLGLHAVQGFLLAGAVLFACWPALVLSVGREEGVQLPWFLAAILLPALTTTVVLVGVSGDRLLLVVPIVVGVAVGVVLSLAVSLLAVLYARSTPTGRAVGLGLGIAILAVVAFTVSGAAASPLSGMVQERHADLVETRQYGAPPQAAFAFETTGTADGTRLTVTHDGGDRVRADRLRVEGDLAPVPGVDQSRSGPWNGTTSPAADGPVVEPGDPVTVGLADAESCGVRVVFRRGGDAATLGKYTCERGG